MHNVADGFPFTATADGVRLRVRLRPRAGRTALCGVARGSDGRVALQVKVAAPPVKGAANAALIAFLADALELPKSRVQIVSGETARLKLVELAGEPAAIAARLTDWIATGTASAR